MNNKIALSMTIKRVLKIIAISATVLILPVIIYFLFAVVFSVIPIKEEKAYEKDINIFLISNGVHSDLALPVRNEIKDWSSEIKFNHSKGNDSSYKYLAFGWGDKGFYLETPTWADLKFHTAFNAVFGLSSSAVHTTFIYDLSEGQDCVNLNLNREQYQRLVSFIESKFEFDEKRHVQQIITNANYGLSDAFYEAKGRYNLFYTCNTWINSGLKVCGQKACLWTPFVQGIFWHYRKK